MDNNNLRPEIEAFLRLPACQLLIRYIARHRDEAMFDMVESDPIENPALLCRNQGKVYMLQEFSTEQFIAEKVIEQFNYEMSKSKE